MRVVPHVPVGKYPVAWDIFSTAPVAMAPWALDGFKIPVIVCPVEGGGFVAWNLDVMVSQAQTGYGSCAPLESFFEGVPEFDKAKKCWFINEKSSVTPDTIRTTLFYKPTKKMQAWYAESKKWLPPLEKLQAEANRMYSQEYRLQANHA